MYNLLAERKWKNCFVTKENAGKLKEFCRDFHIKFETSECVDLIHFEIFVSDLETEKVNEFLVARC